MKKVTKHYDEPEIQAAYEFACMWDYDEETAESICDQCNGYGSSIISVSAEEWYSDADTREGYFCLIGEDASLNTFIIELR